MNLHNVPQFFTDTGGEYVHVLTQAAVLEENQESWVHNGIIFGGKKKNQAYRRRPNLRRPKGKHEGKKLESLFR